MSAQDEKALSDLGALRNWGFSVAIHNDYRQRDERRTFWLFTHPSGRWIKGEGATDSEALTEALKMAWASPVADAVGLRAETEAWRSEANRLREELEEAISSRDEWRALHDQRLGLQAADRDRIEVALEIAHQHGVIQGSHHSTWMQMVRALTGKEYDEWVRNTSANGSAAP